MNFASTVQQDYLLSKYYIRTYRPLRAKYVHRYHISPKRWKKFELFYTRHYRDLLSKAYHSIVVQLAEKIDKEIQESVFIAFLLIYTLNHVKHSGAQFKQYILVHNLTWTAHATTAKRSSEKRLKLWYVDTLLSSHGKEMYANKVQLTNGIDPYETTYGKTT